MQGGGTSFIYVVITSKSRRSPLTVCVPGSSLTVFFLHAIMAKPAVSRKLDQEFWKSIHIHFAFYSHWLTIRQVSTFCCECCFTDIKTFITIMIYIIIIRIYGLRKWLLILTINVGFMLHIPRMSIIIIIINSTMYSSLENASYKRVIILFTFKLWLVT